MKKQIPAPGHAIWAYDTLMRQDVGKRLFYMPRVSAFLRTAAENELGEDGPKVGYAALMWLEQHGVVNSVSRARGFGRGGVRLFHIRRVQLVSNGRGYYSRDESGNRKKAVIRRHRPLSKTPITQDLVIVPPGTPRSGVKRAAKRTGPTSASRDGQVSRRESDLAYKIAVEFAKLLGVDPTKTPRIRAITVHFEEA